MISFRYHIVSIVAVFLALAVGIVLGSGPLRGETDTSLVAQAEADRKAKAELRDQITALEAGNDFTDGFAAQVAPRVLADRLDGRTVTMLVLPGADESTLTSLTEVVETAGGTVGGSVQVTEGLVDVSNKQLVDELSNQLLDGAQDVTVAEGAGTYERLGAMLGRAIATTEDGGAPLDDTANSILAGLSTADLLAAPDDRLQRGSLVLVVGGTGPGAAAAGQGSEAVVTSLVAAIDQGSDGVVVAGPVAAAREAGVVQAVRSEAAVAGEVSTVDTLDRTAGQVVTVLALAQQAQGVAGHYGSVDAPDGAAPGAGGEEPAEG